MTSCGVRVFSVDLDQPAAVLERLEAVLPEAERAAAARRRAARGALRFLLGSELGVAPEAVPISRRCEHCGHPTHGRPTLEDGTISFSLSHSGATALVAFAPGGVRVGVDVEVVRPRPRLHALAARTMSADQHARWLALGGEAEQLGAFLRVWTAKEAYLKAIGTGIATRLRDVPPRVDGWAVVELDAGPGRVAALAAECAEVAVQHRTAPALVRSSGGTAG